MPYIKADQRKRLDAGGAPHDVMELSYAVSRAINQYVVQHLSVGGKLNYEFMNGLWGAVGLAQSEFKRRFIHPYEDRKIEENGDVYTFRA